MAAYYRRISLYPIFIALLSVALWGCGDGTANVGSEETRDGNNGEAPQVSDDYFLVPAGESGLSGHVTDTVELKVFLYDKSTGEPVANQAVSYEIVSEDTDADGTLSAYNGTTGEDGSAAVDLTLGALEGTVAIKAEHESSNAVNFTVDVLGLETGDLEIELINTGATSMTLNDIDVRVYPNGDYSCAEFRPLSQREIGEMATYVAGTVNDRPLFEGLSAEERVMVTAVGLGQAGQLAGAGCIEDVEILADEVTQKQIALQLIPLNPVGTYDVTANWDFSQAVEDSGAIGATIMRVLNVFENPGQALYDEFMNLLQSIAGLGGTAVDTFMNLTGLDDRLINAINNAVENNDALRRIRDAGRDVRDVVANLEVHSELTIGKMSSNYEFRGTDNWLGITLYWRWNCDANSPPDCGAINLEADSDGRFAQLGALSSEWTGRVAAYNQLQIDTHPLSIRYGQLIMYVLEEVVLPQMTGGNANTLSGAFTYWICDSLVGSIANSNGEICAPDPINMCIDARRYCDMAVGTVFSAADLLVNNLEYDVGLRIGGEGLLLETTSDGFVDRIEDGKFEGFMQNSDLGQTQASPVSATFEAERIDFDSDNL